MADRVLRTDFKRIGRSGPTVDGRVISPDMIDEMAASYKKELFTAMIWPDHSRYSNYGTVEELRSEANDEGGRDLFAVLSPNAFYLSDNRYGQKLFTSMEITTDFRKTGKAYLTGLGATDDPASAATSEIRFSKAADTAGILLTKTVEAITQTFEDQAPAGLIDQIKALFKHQPQEDDLMAVDKAALDALKLEFTALKDTLAALKPAEPDAPKPDDKFAALIARIDAMENKFSEQKPADSTVPADKFTELQTQLTALTEKLSAALTEQSGTDVGEHFGAGTDANEIY